MRSANCTVSGRCAMGNVVRPALSRCKAPKLIQGCAIEIGSRLVQQEEAGLETSHHTCRQLSKRLCCAKSLPGYMACSCC